MPSENFPRALDTRYKNKKLKVRNIPDGGRSGDHSSHDGRY